MEVTADGQCKYRTSLPVAQFSRGDFSLWSVLKNCVGKELSKIAMPVVFNEPLSFLQRMLEYLEYAHLLRMASEQTDPVARMEYIAAFAVSALASNWERLGKPFNPLLGETFELERPEFRAVCEQVTTSTSHGHNNAEGLARGRDKSYPSRSLVRLRDVSERGSPHLA
ncbi:unnamed protein product [Plutella xylostella]|uniref:(diamondback moth) hypothetical protein n=1 Tax=Plutella xylostella TaxID=51655 RepID=A0A8S4G819_PLUXY|nr:unnamed protein product [Plutella xylostella]